MEMWLRFLRFTVKYLVGASMCAIASAALSAETQVDVRPRWKAGDQMNYLLTKTQTRRGNTTGSRTPFQIQVMEATTQGFLVSVRFGESLYDDPQPRIEPLSVVNLRQGLNIQLTVNMNGTIQNVYNWEELQTIILMKTKSPIDKPEQDRSTASPADKAVERMHLILSSEKNFRSAFLQDIQLLFPTLGNTYTIDQPVEYETELPISAELGMIRAKGTFQLKSADVETGMATFTRNQEADPKEFENAALMALKRNKGTSAPVIYGVTTRLRDMGEFVVDYRTGWIRSLTNTRRVVVFISLIQKDTITIQSE